MSDIYKKLIRQTFLILKKYDKAMDLKMTHCFFVGKNFLKNFQIKREIIIGYSEARFGSRSTRYKDVFDIYYLKEEVDVDKLRGYIKISYD